MKEKHLITDFAVIYIGEDFGREGISLLWVELLTIKLRDLNDA